MATLEDYELKTLSEFYDLRSVTMPFLNTFPVEQVQNLLDVFYNRSTLPFSCQVEAGYDVLGYALAQALNHPPHGGPLTSPDLAGYLEHLINNKDNVGMQALPWKTIALLIIELVGKLLKS